MMKSRNRSNWNVGGRVAAVAAIAGLALGAGDAFACSLQNWSVSNAVVANQPDGAAGDPSGDPTAVSRYEGLCGMIAGSGVTAFTQDNRPNGIDRIRARFYVLNDGIGGPVTLYEGYGDESGGNSQFSVDFDPVTNEFTLTDTASGVNVSQNGDGGWESVEIDWDSGGDNLALTVNGQAPVTASGLTTGSLESVRLGNLDGVAVRGADTGLEFDAYEAHRTTEVGRLCNCNANGSADDTVNVQDVVLVVNEASGTGLASGTPDCNEDGQVLVQDVTQTVNIAGGDQQCIE